MIVTLLYLIFLGLFFGLMGFARLLNVLLKD